MSTGIRLLTLSSCCLVAAAAGLDSGYERLVAEEPHMGTVVRITAYVPAGVDGVVAIQRAFGRVRELSYRFSDYREDSEVSRLSRNSGSGDQVVSPDLFSLLEKSLEVSRLSGGAFDVTFGNVAHAGGVRHVVLDAAAQTVSTAGAVRFDFGGIAKGFIADAALAVLREHGVERALVAIAGDIAAGEAPPGEAGWLVAVDAIGARGTVERELVLLHQAVSTSGDRERSSWVAGERRSHIVDPRTGRGMPAGDAVTVVASTGADADAWATALRVLGPHHNLHLPSLFQVFWANEP